MTLTDAALAAELARDAGELLLEGADHPIDHIVKIIAVPLVHDLLEVIKFINGCAKFFHPLRFFANFIFLQITRVELLIFPFVDEFIAKRQIGQVFINTFIDKFR